MPSYEIMVHKVVGGKVRTTELTKCGTRKALAQMIRLFSLCLNWEPAEKFLYEVNYKLKPKQNVSPQIIKTEGDTALKLYISRLT